MTRTSLISAALIAAALAARPAFANCTASNDEKAVHSAYFQSSKVIWGYEQKAGVKITAYSFAKKENAKAYAEQMQADVEKLSTPSTKDAKPTLCLNWSHIFYGVKDDGQELTWANLKLDAPAAKKEQKKEGEGLVNDQKFFAAMRSTLQGQFSDWKPLFGVVDSNYFHQMSAALVEEAYTHHKHEGKHVKLLVQIDHHPDFSGDPSDKMRCNNWINYVARAITVNDVKREAVVEKVLWINGLSSACNDYSKNKCLEGKGSFATCSKATVAAQLAALVPEGSAADVYVTVDRDIMAYNYTGWNNGYQSDKSIHRAVADIVHFIKAERAGSHLVGFDVTGLPEDKPNQQTNRKFTDCSGETVKDSGNPGDDKVKALHRANKDVFVFYDLFVLSHKELTGNQQQIGKHIDDALAEAEKR